MYLVTLVCDGREALDTRCCAALHMPAVDAEGTAVAARALAQRAERKGWVIDTLWELQVQFCPDCLPEWREGKGALVRTGAPPGEGCKCKKASTIGHPDPNCPKYGG